MLGSNLLIRDLENYGYGAADTGQKSIIFLPVLINRRWEKAGLNSNALPNIRHFNERKQ